MGFYHVTLVTNSVERLTCCALFFGCCISEIVVLNSSVLFSTTKFLYTNLVAHIVSYLLLLFIVDHQWQHLITVCAQSQQYEESRARPGGNPRPLARRRVQRSPVALPVHGNAP